MKRTTWIAAIACIIASIPCAVWGQYSGAASAGPYGGMPSAFAGPGPGAAGGGAYPAGAGAPAIGPYGPGAAPGASPDGGSPMCAGDCGGSRNGLPRLDAYVDGLYMAARNSTVSYGVTFNGPSGAVPPATVVQVAPPGELLPTYTGGIRGGLMVGLDDCNSIGVSYLHFENDVYDQISTDTFQIRSLVSHPATYGTDGMFDFDAASAQQHIMLDIAEIDYKWMVLNDNCTTLAVVVAGRYGSLKQNFGAAFVSNAIGEQDVNTEIQFEGGGLRLGFDATEAGRLGFSFYTRGSASCLAGSIHSTYLESSTFSGNVVNTGYRDERLVPILDFEAGVSWTSPGEHVRLSCGFLVSSWFNVIKTTDLIQAVQQNDFNNVSNSSMTFDGLTGSVEVRY